MHGVSAEDVSDDMAGVVGCLVLECPELSSGGGVIDDEKEAVAVCNQCIGLECSGDLEISSLRVADAVGPRVTDEHGRLIHEGGDGVGDGAVVDDACVLKNCAVGSAIGYEEFGAFVGCIGTKVNSVADGCEFAGTGTRGPGNEVLE